MNLSTLRWLLAAGTGFFGVWSMKKVLHSGGGLEAFPPILFAAAALLATILLLSHHLVRPICDFVAECFVGVIYPGGRASKPALSYLLARRYRDQMRIHESVAEYEKILHYYPAEKDAYLELLPLLSQVGDDRAFRKYSRRYVRHFQELPTADQPRIFTR